MDARDKYIDKSFEELKEQIVSKLGVNPDEYDKILEIIKLVYRKGFNDGYDYVAKLLAYMSSLNEQSYNFH